MPRDSFLSNVVFSLSCGRQGILRFKDEDGNLNIGPGGFLVIWHTDKCDQTHTHASRRMVNWQKLYTNVRLGLCIQCQRCVTAASLYHCVLDVVSAAVPMTALMPPVGVDATTLSATAVLVSWSDSDSGGQVDGHEVLYTVRYRPVVSRAGTQRASAQRGYRYVNATSSMTARLEQLRPHTEYEISVRLTSATVDGRRRHSAWSMSVLVTTHDAGTIRVLL